MKVLTFIWNIVRRTLWIVSSLINWALYAAFFALYVVFLFLLVAVQPLLWLVLGFDNTTKVLDFLFTHSNKELWHAERFDGDTFTGVIPLHAAYIQEKCINKLFL